MQLEKNALSGMENTDIDVYMSVSSYLTEKWCKLLIFYFSDATPKIL